MDKLAAYSDDEEEASIIRAEETEKGQAIVGDEVAQPSASTSGKQTNGKDGVRHANGEVEKEVAGKSTGMTGEGVASSSMLPAKTSSRDVHLYAPVPRMVQGQGSSSVASGSESTSTFDPEWSLGIEKSSEGVDEALQAKLAHFHTLKEEQGTHFNESLGRNRSFRNPHIYSKLVEWVGVEETGSGYSEMVKGTLNPDRIWISSKQARAALKEQGGREAIATLQKRRQEEADERKRKGRRENIDFVGEKPQGPLSSSRSRTEAIALAESRAQKIRDEMATRAGKSSSGSRVDEERQRRKHDERGSHSHQHRSHHHRH